MRDGDSTGFFGVISKIGLGIHVGVVADNFDCAFVCSHRAVGAKTPELALHGTLGRYIQAFADFQ